MNRLNRRSDRIGLTAALTLGIAIVASSATAQQIQATTTGNLFLRAAPGTASPAVAVMPPGAVVEVSACALQYRWCEVSYDGQTGWASALYLSVDGALLANAAASLGIALTDAPSGAPPAGAPAPAASPGPTGTTEICFFEQADYGGESFCIAMGQSDRVIGAEWEDRIASIRVGSNGLVEVCAERNYREGCEVFAEDAASLPSGLQDGISSYRTTGVTDSASYGEACFFTEEDFGGDPLCARQGQNDRVLGGGWEDAISSVRLTGGVVVVACQGRGYDEPCQTLTGSAASLDGGFDDAISSYRIE